MWSQVGCSTIISLSYLNRFMFYIVLLFHLLALCGLIKVPFSSLLFFFLSHTYTLPLKKSIRIIWRYWEYFLAPTKMANLPISQQKRLIYWTYICEASDKVFKVSSIVFNKTTIDWSRPQVEEILTSFKVCERIKRQSKI